MAAAHGDPRAISVTVVAQMLAQSKQSRVQAAMPGSSAQHP